MTFDAYYHSNDIENIRGQQFDQIICAGISSLKWQANEAPENDRKCIEVLFNSLASVRVDRFILLSTVDVLGDDISDDELNSFGSTANEPYGRNRRVAEQRAIEMFPVCHVVRLPALFGPGLRKNILFDLMNARRLDHIPTQGQMQWYAIENLLDDLNIVVRNNLPLVHFATEPVSMVELVSRV